MPYVNLRGKLNLYQTRKFSYQVTTDLSCFVLLPLILSVVQEIGQGSYSSWKTWKVREN